MARRVGGKAAKRCRSKYAGTPTGYRHHIEKRKKDRRHVPCDACRQAIRLHHKNYRDRRLANGAVLVPREPTKTHGYRLVGGQFQLDVTGTRRRVQALGVMGYGWDYLGQRLGGIAGTNVGALINERSWVYRETAEKIMALYDELSMIPPPDTRATKIAKTRLSRRGWVSPLAWEDEMIDDPNALPQGLTRQGAWDWYCKAATMHERINWVLENGIPEEPPPARPKRPSRRRNNRSLPA